jgi:hypothetical protein
MNWASDQANPRNNLIVDITDSCLCELFGEVLSTHPPTFDLVVDFEFDHQSAPFFTKLGSSNHRLRRLWSPRSPNPADTTRLAGRRMSADSEGPLSSIDENWPFARRFAYQSPVTF